jgi:hypothetical protein
MLIDLYSSATGLEATSAASVSSAADILQGLPSNSTVQSINNLLTTDLGLSAAALLDSTGTAATTTTIDSNGNSITTVAPTANPTSANSTPDVNSLLLANPTPTSATTQAVSSGTAVTTTNTSPVSNTIPLAAPTPTAATSAAIITATPNIAAPETTAPAVSNVTLSSVAMNASSTLDVTSALSDNFLTDSVAQALANIGGNPTYASTVAGLYMSAVIFHTQQASADALASSAEDVQPVTAAQHASAVKLAR